MKIVTCIASRGLVHSRTMESVLKNLQSRSKDRCKIIFTHDQPIPQAQNSLVGKALKLKADYLWFVEEDMLLPNKVINRMLEMNKPVVAVDYAVGEKRYSTIAYQNGEILWCGLGCTLIKREVFDKIGYPWFEADKTVRITSQKPFRYVIDEDVPYKYGGHDILFGLKCKEKGVEISQLKGVTAGHIKPVETGRDGSNDGTHKFEVWKNIRNFQNYT